MRQGAAAQAHACQALALEQGPAQVEVRGGAPCRRLLGACCCLRAARLPAGCCWLPIRRQVCQGWPRRVVGHVLRPCSQRGTARAAPPPLCTTCKARLCSACSPAGFMQDRVMHAAEVHPEAAVLPPRITPPPAAEGACAEPARLAPVCTAMSCQPGLSEPCAGAPPARAGTASGLKTGSH